MPIARRLKWYLEAHEVRYEVLSHTPTANSLDTARAADIPHEQLAKSVLLEDTLGYLIAIVPASRRIALDNLREQLQRHLELAKEAELHTLFFDCEVGAVPPVGEAYGIPSVVDDGLLALREVYFEAGDHQDLIHLGGPEFAQLLAHARHGHLVESL